MKQSSPLPENAHALAAVLPDPDCTVHALITGDFVFGDLIAAIIERHGAPRELLITTLSLSQANVTMLAKVLERSPVPIFFLISHYFSRTNVAIFAALTALSQLHPNLRIRIARTHCKVTLLDYPGAAWVIETSANLRSSGNLEQVTILNDRPLLDFHREWMKDPDLPQK